MAKEKMIQDWGEALETYAVPQWEELPKLSLYMDQVIGLMEEYLSIYEKTGEKLITSSMVNNYVKLGIIPKPDKKRYNRVHLAYLIMICILKQVLSISMIQKMLPLTLTEEELAHLFNAFQDAQRQAFNEVTDRVYTTYGHLNNEDAKPTDYFSFFAQTALTGNIYKIISAMIAENINTITK
ncbi:MAG: DUF1836 domain-containing protein [Ruminococcaceae bacterium]|nr:DUF1836 domain-containing protein [Oscillospiraceae bacterium]